MHELVRADLGRRSLDDDPAVVHHRHVLGDGQRDVHVVLDQEQGDRRGRAATSISRQLHPLGPREPGRGLVEHHESRLPASAIPTSSWRCSPCDRSRTARSSMLARARPARRTSRACARSSPSRPVQTHRAAGGRPRRRDRQVEVVLDRQAEEEPRGLVRPGQAEADPRAGRAGCVTSLPEELDRPVRRRELAGDDVEERGLPRPVRAEDRPPLAGRDVEIDVAHGVKAAEAPADPPQGGGSARRLRLPVLSRTDGHDLLAATRHPPTVERAAATGRTPGSRGRESACRR